MITDKQVKGFKKAAVSKLVSKLNRLKAEDSKDDVTAALIELKTAFTAFEEAHDVVCNNNIDFDDFMEEEKNFLDVEKQYAQCLTDIKPWITGDGLAPSAQPSCSHNLGKLLTLPKVDIQPYDGDCMMYSTFMSVFNRCVATVLDDDEDRLIHLKRLTTSHAASAILSCNGSSGYKKALSILEQRFGNKHLIALRFLWNVNDSVVHDGMLVHPFDVLCCACASISLLHECTNSVLDVVIHNISLHLSLINDCLLSVSFTEEMSNLVIKSESVLFFYGFDPTKCFVYDPLMSRLISDCNMSLNTDAILTAHSQLVSKILGVSWVMLLRQWLSWVKSLGSWIINTCPMLCYTFVFDNG